jgi:hypothetical protein
LALGFQLQAARWTNCLEHLKANVVIDRKWSDISELLTVTKTFSALNHPQKFRNLYGDVCDGSLRYPCCFPASYLQEVVCSPKFTHVVPMDRVRTPQCEGIIAHKTSHATSIAAMDHPH